MSSLFSIVEIKVKIKSLSYFKLNQTLCIGSIIIGNGLACILSESNIIALVSTHVFCKKKCSIVVYI